MPPLFAPAHEISRQVQIINAYCREAEHLRDPIHDTSWDLLDELIETHEKIAPRSLFAGEVNFQEKEYKFAMFPIYDTLVKIYM